MIKSVLCVCRGNTCRSPMAEALIWKAILDKTGGTQHISVESAGTYVDVNKDCLNSPANEHSVTCMAERGIDITGHRSRPLSAIRLNDFDLIVCMSDAEVEFVARLRPCGAILLANAANGGVPNPWQKGLPTYQECARDLEVVAQDVVNLIL